jgi:hypothetical protein
MRSPYLASFFVCVACLVSYPRAVSAQSAGDAHAEPSPGAQALRQDIERLRSDFDQLRQQYGDRLSALEAKLAALEGRSPQSFESVAAAPPAASTPPATQLAETGPSGPEPTVEVPSGAAGAGGPTGALPVYGAATAASKVFNPDMAVIGDFLGAGGSNSVNPGPALEMHESEASFQAIVDPYARADFFVSFGEEGVDLEEGYVTFPTVPGGLLVRVGKMRSAFGKVNGLHNHVLPWTDRPLVINNLLGGEDGIDDAGMSVARLIPNRWLFLEATGQVFRGDSSDVFRSSRRGDLSAVGHLRAYHDITESSNVDLGVSYAHGHNAAGFVDGVDSGRFTTGLFGVDATFRWRPLARSIYHSFVGRSEIVWSRRDQVDGRQDATGAYVSADYQFARRWFVGGRYDRSGRAAAASLTDIGQSAILTYWPSEFSQIRGQYRRTEYAAGPTANEALFQLQFSIGAHGAHPF